MLNVDDLESQIKTALKNIIPPAIEQCKLAEYPMDSEIGKSRAKAFAESFDELVSEELAKIIASAIDYYVKNISIFGTIITVGGMVTQTAVISAAPTPIAAGVIPNTLGVK